jgi:hypothetical protein
MKFGRHVRLEFVAAGASSDGAALPDRCDFAW